MPKTWGQLLQQERECIAEEFLAGGCHYKNIDFEKWDLERCGSVERRIREFVEHYIPESKTPMYAMEALHLEGNAIIIGDVEIPDHDNAMMNKAIQVGKSQKIKQLIVNGDLLSADGFSSHPPGAFCPSTTVGQDICTTREILRILTKCFTDGVYVVTGNHDMRVRWATNGQLGLDTLIYSGKVTITPIGYLYLCSKSVDWKITHPKNYSKIPGSVARQIAINEDINVVAAHSHHLSWSVTSNGKYVAIDGGHCRDVYRTAYKVEADTTYPKWCSGFTVIKDGFGYILSKQFTDWSLWT
jgi:predicted phosphodiesterase